MAMARSMRPVALRALLLLAAVAVACTSTLVSGTSDFHEWDGYVIDLNDANFEENLDGREVVVNFFAPWCGSCQEFEPVYTEFAEMMYHEPSGIRNVVITRVDCTLNPETCTARRVQAYPSVQFFRDGALVAEYSGDRSIEDMAGWVEEVSHQADHIAGKAQPTPHKSQTQQQQPQQQQQRPSSTGATGAQSTTPTQGQAKTQPQTAAGATPNQAPAAGTAPSASILPEWRLSDLTDVQQLKRHIVGLADLPLSLFQSHPWMVMSIMWTLGVFQGTFFGILWALREKR